jgi:hypothetical protein
MARGVQELMFGVGGQSLVFDAPCRPSSITSVTVLPWDAGDDDTPEDATSGSGSIDAVNTTFDADSGISEAEPRTCNLAATTSIVVGRVYLAVNAQLESEWVEVAAIASGASVTARSPLQNDFASGATFQGTRITMTVDQDWILDENHISDDADPNPGYRVRWEWVGTPPGGASQTFVHYTYLDVVRAPAQLLVTPADMALFTPAWTGILPTDHRQDGGARLIAEAYTEVKMRLYAARVPDEQTRNAEIMAQLVKYAARMLLHRAQFEAGGELEPYQLARDELTGLVNQLVAVSSVLPVGQDTTGAGARPRATGLWKR